MPSLNQLAARIANSINQPNNHELLERIKDMVKSVFATRIRQSTERHGIDTILKLSLIMEMDKYEYKELFNYPNIILDGKQTVYISKLKVPTPIRIHNDAPFIYVGDLKGHSFTYNDLIVGQYLLHSFPTGGMTSYFTENGYLLVHRPLSYQREDRNSIAITDDRNIIEEVRIDGIFENPEEVLTLYLDDDGQDINLPFPNDMFESIMQEILRTEFNLVPRDSSITVNQQTPVNNG